MNGKAKWIVTGWLMVALSPVWAGAAVNNEQAPSVDNERTPLNEQSRPMEQAVEPHPGLEKANELIGARVINDKNERLGTIEDIVLTPDRKAVSYVVLSHGGLWGWGGKLFAVPWSEFEIRTAANVLVLKNVSPDDLKNAKGFDKKNWPAEASENWLNRDVGPGGSEPAAMETRPTEGMESERTAETPEHREHAEGERMESRADRPGSPGVAEPAAAKAEIKHRRLSELVGLTVKNNQGEDLGELEDIVVDVREGKVAYAVLSMKSGFLGLNKDLAAIPWSSFEIVPELGTARLNADKETLEAIAFDADEFPDLEDREYSRRIHERFGATPYWEAFGFVPGEKETRPETERREDSTPTGKESGRYEPEYNPGEARTIYGTIMSVGTFRPEGTFAEVLRLRIKTDDDKTVTVHVGPRLYVEDQKIDFHYGDKVTVTGSPAKVGWRDVIVAAQIKTGDKTLDLRTEEGKPRWDAGDHEGSRSDD